MQKKPQKIEILNYKTPDSTRIRGFIIQPEFFNLSFFFF